MLNTTKCRQDEKHGEGHSYHDGEDRELFMHGVRPPVAVFSHRFDTTPYNKLSCSSLSNNLSYQARFNKAGNINCV